MGLAFLVLIGVAIYSISHLTQTSTWFLLTQPTISNSIRKDLPQFEQRPAWNLINPQNLMGKWTLISFWSITCPPCIEEMPSLNRLALDWQGPPFQIITVNLDEDADNVYRAARLMEEQQLSIPMLMDQEGILKAAFNVTEFPKHFLVNPEGKIVWEERGAFRWDSVDTRSQLLKLVELQAPESVAVPAE